MPDILLCVFFACFFFFFKQKTAYEMRISDWSSDVCSSDLSEDLQMGEIFKHPRFQNFVQQHHTDFNLYSAYPTPFFHTNFPTNVSTDSEIGRASCRERVCRTCRSRWSPYH